jgi:hypothetical protein
VGMMPECAGEWPELQGAALARRTSVRLMDVSTASSLPLAVL